MHTKVFLFNIFKGWTWNKICSLACSNANAVEKPQNNLVLICTDQKPFWPFLKIKKNIKQLCILNFLLGDCFLMYKEEFCTFSKKILYLSSLRFFDNENFAACAMLVQHASMRQNLPFFGIGLLKMYPISKNMLLFKNRKKC